MARWHQILQNSTFLDRYTFCRIIILFGIICMCDLKAKMSAFQADDVGSIPITCSLINKGEFLL